MNGNHCTAFEEDIRCDHKLTKSHVEYSYFILKLYIIINYKREL